MEWLRKNGHLVALTPGSLGLLPVAELEIALQIG